MKFDPRKYKGVLAEFKHLLSPTDYNRVIKEFKNSIKLFGELVDRHSQIVALFCGHFHRPIRKSMGLFDANIAPPVCNLIDYSSTKTGPNHIGNFQLHKFGKGNEFTTEVKMISH